MNTDQSDGYDYGWNAGYDSACHDIDDGLAELLSVLDIERDELDDDAAEAALISDILKTIAAALKDAGIKLVKDEDEGGFKVEAK